ncbi:hypothetical protein HON22_03005 [Candidatus Peregrinibacteria bacterium]|jgi:HD-GYP domain-containing protein (c-di-GMP phosphodiesterase class II)|nr:hypothetical protein [Candidatus Peregrinibacteria bacterium]
MATINMNNQREFLLKNKEGGKNSLDFTQSLKRATEIISGSVYRIKNYISSLEIPKEPLTTEENIYIKKYSYEVHTDIKTLFLQLEQIEKDSQKKQDLRNEVRNILESSLAKLLNQQQEYEPMQNTNYDFQNEYVRLSKRTIHSCLQDNQISGGLIALKELYQNNKGTAMHSIDAMKKGIIMGFLIKQSQIVDFSDKDIIEFGKSMLFHDIGKLYVSNDIINKKGKLSGFEYEQMKLHTLFGEWILSHLGENPTLQSAVAGSHHEGKGYGSLLNFIEKFSNAYIVNRENKNFQLFSEMAAVIDIYSAIKEKRSYKKEMSTGRTLMIMSHMAHKGEINKEFYDIWYQFIFKHETVLFHKGSEMFLDSSQKAQLNLDPNKEYTARVTQNHSEKTKAICDIYEDSSDETPSHRVIENKVLNLEERLAYPKDFKPLQANKYGMKKNISKFRRAA